MITPMTARAWVAQRRAACWLKILRARELSRLLAGRDGGIGALDLLNAARVAPWFSPENEGPSFILEELNSFELMRGNFLSRIVK